MASNDVERDELVYECFGCGRRVESADPGFCPACGGEFRNVHLARHV